MRRKNQWTGAGPRSRSLFKEKPKGKGKGKHGGDGEPELEDNTMLMLDPNRVDPSVGHWYREASVCGLADLFKKFGDTFSARAIYMYYLSFTPIVYRRPHGKSAPERKVAAWERFRETGHCGHGRR